MSVEKLAETVGEVADRRRFLARLGGATLGLLGLAGLAPGRASALVTTHGCDLCTSPGGCSPELVCAWCWLGRCHNHGGTNLKHKCCEGYRGSRCDGACPVSCSYYFGSYAC
jgi:hypothetical protein